MKQALDALCDIQAIDELNRKKRRSCSVRQINRDRRKNGFFALTFLRLKEIDHQQFFIYTRVTPQIYEVLLNHIKPFLEKASIREPVQPECRLAVTLLYLTHGTSFQSLVWSFKLGKETGRCIVLETTEIIWSKLGRLYLTEPSENDYKEIAQDYRQMWNFFSIVLLATCDARYRFTHIDLGAYGSQSDGGIFQISKLGKRLLSKNLSIPKPAKLPNSDIKLPHFFVGDAAFPLCTNLMRPYPGVLLPKEKEIFNKRLSRARRTIENAFGILVCRWRVLLTTLHLLPENAEKVVLSCVTLENFIMLHNTSASSYMPYNFTHWEDSSGAIQEGLWRSEVGNSIPSILGSANSHHHGGRTSKDIRSILCDFFSRS